MKIGILGGTFDPIHNGHLLIAQCALEQFSLDEIWFLPNGNPPHKHAVVTQEHLTHRIRMVELALDKYPMFQICLYEAQIECHSYSNLTMKHLQNSYPENEFFFIIGADSLFSLEKWYQFEDLLQRCTFIAAIRDQKDGTAVANQIEYLHTMYNARIQPLDSPLVEVSSSTIREAVCVDKSICDLVPDEVATYIKTNELYKNNHL